MTGILIADDSQDYAQFLRDSFLASGMAPAFLAYDPPSALDLIRNCQPRVLISDYDFGARQIDGLLLCSRARQLYPPVQCILISGLILGAEALQHQGVRYYLRKPFAFPILRSFVIECLNKPMSEKTLRFQRGVKGIATPPR